MAAAASSTLACAASSDSRAAVTTQWFMWSLSRLTATESSADWTAETCVRMSMQYSPCEIMRCRPRTWPSMRRRRAR